MNVCVLERELQATSRTAFIGETVHLRCGNTITLGKRVTWHFKPSLDAEAKIIPGDYFFSAQGRHNINGSVLIINNVKRNDSGSYTCIKDSGRRPVHSINLTVQGEFIELILHGMNFRSNSKLC